MAKKSAFELSRLKHNAIPFDLVEIDQFLTELKSAIERGKAQVDQLTKNSAAPNFKNTIEALETSGQDVSLISTLFYNLLHAHTDDKLQALAQEFGPIMSAYSSDITLNQDLFQRIEMVYKNRQQEKLNKEEQRLLEETYSNFVRNGSKLSEKEKQRLREIDAELSKLSPTFSENLLKATNAFELWIENPEDLAGLPEATIEAYREAAKAKHQDRKWLVTLQAPSLIPFLQYAKNRELRRNIWFSNGSRAFNDAYDNQKTIQATLRLRQERAKLLSYTNHAAFVLEKRMAETPERVFSF